MTISPLQWQIEPNPELPPAFISLVGDRLPHSDGRYAARLLWNRGIRTAEDLVSFLDCDLYHPNSPFAFGKEMDLAVDRLVKAREMGQKVTIWGDFDADGVTATSVLWEGLGQFFPQHLQLSYYIPHRQKESHGLNCEGIDRLAASGTSLVVTCDTGSTNLIEIAYARSLGIDLIITDHHTLPLDRPDAVAIINPRYFAENHPLYHLSGVAVAYKLIEALYVTLPDVPQQDLECLLDLVAIGLVADLVQLKGDCRYLAQKGIQQLKKQNQKATATRAGVSILLELCRKNGDRPTDISYGIGPRINAVSRIYGDSSFCVELLTNKDEAYCRQLAESTDLANSRRKELQKNTLARVRKKLETIDLSTTSVIVLEDPQWEAGVLGLVAGKIAQEYARPTILLTSGMVREEEREIDEDLEVERGHLARGSARSTNNIDLYELVKSQAHLLHRFGGHPLAAGLSLPTENITLFREAIDRQALQLFNDNLTDLKPTVTADLTVTVAELGKKLFDELGLLEPYGMGNPIPKLLIKNCWFTNVWHKNITDFKNRKIPYLKTDFKIWDNSSNEGFLGIWWEHSKDELPQNVTCDAIVELDYNYAAKEYQVRLIVVREVSNDLATNFDRSQIEIVDRRHQTLTKDELEDLSLQSIVLDKCPTCWEDLSRAYSRAIDSRRNLILAYSLAELPPSATVWLKFIGIAKYLVRQNKTIEIDRLEVELGVRRKTVYLGLQLLEKIGFKYRLDRGIIELSLFEIDREIKDSSIDLFFQSIAEEQFQSKYFDRVPLNIIQKNLAGITPF